MTETGTAAGGRRGRVARTALVLLLAGAVAAGFSGTLVRLSELGPVATAFWRMSLAIPALWLWLAATEPGAGAPAAGPRRARDWLLLAAAGLLFAVEIAVWNRAVGLTSVANATLFSNFSPLVVSLGGWLLLRHRFSRTFVAGMLVALAGGALLMGDSLRLDRAHLAGDALGLLTALLFGAYILVIAALRARFSTARIMVWTCAFASLALLPAAWLEGGAMAPASLAGWAAVAALALVCQAGAQSMLTQALAHLPAAFSAVGFLLVPVAATVIAWLVLGEAVGPWQAAGGAVVLAGIVIAGRGSR